MFFIWWCIICDRVQLFFYNFLSFILLSYILLFGSVHSPTFHEAYSVKGMYLKAQANVCSFSVREPNVSKFNRFSCWNRQELKGLQGLRKLFHNPWFLWPISWELFTIFCLQIWHERVLSNFKFNYRLINYLFDLFTTHKNIHLSKTFY